MPKKSLFFNSFCSIDALLQLLRFAIEALSRSLNFQTQARLWCVQFSARGVLHWTVNPDDGPGPMDKPCQSDSFDGHVEGQIAGIAFGSAGAPLYKHERKGRKQLQQICMA